MFRIDPPIHIDYFWAFLFIFDMTKYEKIVFLCNFSCFQGISGHYRPQNDLKNYEKSGVFIIIVYFRRLFWYFWIRYQFWNTYKRQKLLFYTDLSCKNSYVSRWHLILGGYLTICLSVLSKNFWYNLRTYYHFWAKITKWRFSIINRSIFIIFLGIIHRIFDKVDKYD